MLYFSRNLLVFSGLTFVLSLAFNLVYEGYLLFDDWVPAAGVSTLYLLAIVVAGALLSGKDRAKLLRSNIGLMYHLSAFVIVTSTRIIWSLWWHPFYESSNVLGLVVTGVWGVILGIHFVVVKRNDGAKPNETLFE